MNILVIDAQGGGMGKLVIDELKRRLPGQPQRAVLLLQRPLYKIRPSAERGGAGL